MRAKLLSLCLAMLWLGFSTSPIIAEDDLQEVKNSLGMRLRLIPAGKFIMGSPDNERGRQEREKQHEVAITREFYLGVYEVTQAEYFAVMNRNPSRFGRDERKSDPAQAKRFDRHPVDSLTWHDAVAFCEKLSELEAENAAGRRYRLPTEAEWEYACRAGSRGLWCFGNEPEKLREHAWYRTRASELTTNPVGSKRPNAWQLFDMHGNVWEWCDDWYAEDYGDRAPPEDPQGPDKGQSKVIRGGSYLSVPAHTRSAARFHDPPQIGDEDVGFRVVMELAHEKARHSK